MEQISYFTIAQPVNLSIWNELEIDPRLGFRVYESYFMTSFKIHLDDEVSLSYTIYVSQVYFYLLRVVPSASSSTHKSPLRMNHHRWAYDDVIVNYIINSFT